MSRADSEPERRDGGDAARRLVGDLARIGRDLEILKHDLDDIEAALEGQLRDLVRHRLMSGLREVEGLDESGRRLLVPVVEALAARVARHAELDIDAQAHHIDIRSTRPQTWQRTLRDKLAQCELGSPLAASVDETLQRTLKSLDGTRLDLDAGTRTRLEGVTTRLRDSRADLHAAGTEPPPPEPA